MATARLLAPRPDSGVPIDIAVAAFALAGSLVLLSHGGSDASRSGAPHLDLVGVVLAACSTMPLVAWRRFPLGVFAVTAAASVLLAGLGYPLDLMLGPVAALYLLAASREWQTPWTPLATTTVGGLLVAYLGATAGAQGTLSGRGVLHTRSLGRSPGSRASELGAGVSRSRSSEGAP